MNGGIDEQGPDPTADDTLDKSSNEKSDTTDSYLDDVQSIFAQWGRRAINSRLDPRQTTLAEWTGRESIPVSRSTSVNRVAETVLSPRVVVALGLAVDLLFRTLIDIKPVLITLVDLLAPVVSLSASMVTQTAIGRATTWLVLFGVLYAVTPRLFPRDFRSKLDTAGFRLLFVCQTAMFGQLVRAIAERDLGPVSVSIGSLILIFGGSVIITTYLWWFLEWDLLDPKGEGSRFMNSIIAGNIVSERRYIQKLTGSIRKFLDATQIITVGLIISIPALVAGWLMYGFVRIQPLPDLLAVGLLVSGMFSLSSESRWPVVADSEERLLSNVREATRSYKGAILMVQFATGGALLATVLSLSLSNVPSLIRLAAKAVGAGFTGVPAAFGTAWIAVGALVCSLIGSLHLIWVYLRLLRRLPSFLTAWRGADEVPPVPVARPPGWIIPGFLTLAVGGGCILLLPGLSLPTVGWLWPLGIVPVLLAVLFARRRDATLDGEVPRTENLYLVVSGSVLPVLLAIASWVFVRWGKPLTLAALNEGTLAVILMWPTLIWLGFLQDVSQYSGRHDDVRQYAYAIYLVPMGIWFAISGVMFSFSFSPVFRALSGLLFISAPIFIVFKYFGQV
jgi:hypothetical protein